MDSIGNVFISCGDGSNIRKVNTSGIITTVVGNGTYGYSGDGGPASSAELADPVGVCFDKAGNFYMCDFEAHNIRKINISGVISTFAGTTIGYSGDGGSATKRANEITGGYCM